MAVGTIKLARARRAVRSRLARAVPRRAPMLAALRSIPGLLGAVLVAWGLGLVFYPLLWITLGITLLVIDYRFARADAPAPAERGQ